MPVTVTAANIHGTRLMTKAPDPVLARLAGVAARRRPTSKLAIWMAANRDDYAALLAERGPAWEADVVVFVEAGLLPKPAAYDALGPEGAAARRRVVNVAKQTWHRTQGRRSGRRSRKASAMAVTPWTSSPPASPAAPDPDAGQRRLDAFLLELRERSR